MNDDRLVATGYTDLPSALSYLFKRSYVTPEDDYTLARFCFYLWRFIRLVSLRTALAIKPDHSSYFLFRKRVFHAALWLSIFPKGQMNNRFDGAYTFCLV